MAEIKGADYLKIEEKLKIVGLWERKNDKFSTFSLGMKQRLAIAGAMLNDPDVLILDEPTNGLDPQGIIKIREIIQDIAAQGTTIILASHLLDEVEKVCSHVVILERGKTLYSGSVDEMTASYGYIEVGSNDSQKLQNFLESMPYFDKITSQGGYFKAILKEDISSESLNKLLFEQGVVVNHLVKRKESLEQQFLQITQKLK